MGGCRFALHQYQEALGAFLDARGLAEAAGSKQIAGALDFNISSLYFQLGQMDAAADAASRAMARLSGGDRARHLPRLLIHLATLRAEQDRDAEALALFQQGIAAADRANDTEMYALGWNELGEVYLDRKELPTAEHALLEAYRIRKLNRLRSLESSYRNLGKLRLEQGDLDSASVLLDQAVERSQQPGGLLPNWQVYEARGRRAARSEPAPGSFGRSPYSCSAGAYLAPLRTWGRCHPRQRGERDSSGPLRAGRSRKQALFRNSATNL